MVWRQHSGEVHRGWDHDRSLTIRFTMYHTEHAVRPALDTRGGKVEELARESARKTRREHTAYGSVINLASRLCDKQSLPNGNQSTGVRRCRTMVGASHIGQLSLNGFNRPIDAYKAGCWKLARGP
jgi:hypothetical protein